MTVAAPLPHDAAGLHVTGQARYVDDIPVPANTLHLAFGLSTVAHGEIVSMDLDAVRAAPGVVIVLTAGDLPHENDVSPSPWHEPLLAEGTVHHVGQPIFVVAATSHLAARKAVRLARIEYRELPALLTIDAALAANSRYEDGPRIYGRGDTRPPSHRRRSPSRAGSRSAGRSTSTSKARPHSPCRRRGATWSSIPPPSTRPRSSTRSPKPSAGP
jgi:xanthine dehydrogenase large subunit